jgi:hypothetical protein
VHSLERLLSALAQDAHGVDDRLDACEPGNPVAGCDVAREIANPVRRTLRRRAARLEHDMACSTQRRR